MHVLRFLSLNLVMSGIGNFIMLAIGGADVQSAEQMLLMTRATGDGSRVLMRMGRGLRNSIVQFQRVNADF